MNCLTCMGALWLKDEKGDFFKCLDCNGTGDRRENGRANIIDIRVARSRRDDTRAAKVVSNGNDDNAA